MRDFAIDVRSSEDRRWRGDRISMTRQCQHDGSVPGELPLLISVPEAARLLGVGPSLGWTLVHSGELPSVRLGRRVLVPRAALERLVITQETGTDG